MRYLMLLTNPTEAVERWEHLTPEEAKAEREQELPKWGAFMQWAEEQGLKLDGLELDSPHTARTIRGQNGEAVVTDGPYPETKEVSRRLLHRGVRGPRPGDRRRRRAFRSPRPGPWRSAR